MSVCLCIQFETYHNVTTSLEYVLVGTDFALARPEYSNRNEKQEGNVR